jgi:hypothetical protein
VSRLNDGTRPSRVALARALTGEAPPPPGAEAELAAFAAEVEAHPPPPLDLDALRARAAALSASEVEEAVAPRPLPATQGELVPLFRRVAPWAGPLAALAAALLFFIQPFQPADRAGVRLKGEAHLGFDVSRDGHAFPGAPDTVVEAGDRIRFSYGSAGAETLVIVGVDATGTVQTYWPDEGDEAVAIPPGDHLLPGSVQLDDAPGPEVFVAAFDGADAEEVAELVRRAWTEGGVKGLRGLDEARADIAALVLEKR